jgi:hypothetical protein
MGLIRPAGGDQHHLPVFQEANGTFLAKGIGKSQRENPVDPAFQHGRHGGPPEGKKVSEGVLQLAIRNL